MMLKDMQPRYRDRGSLEFSLYRKIFHIPPSSLRSTARYFPSKNRIPSPPLRNKERSVTDPVTNAGEPVTWIFL